MNWLRWWALALSGIVFLCSTIIGLCFSWWEYGRLPGPLTDHFEQANILVRSGKRAEALRLYKQYTDVLPESYLGWYNLATLQQGSGDWLEARRSWQQALVHGSPHKAMVHRQMGICDWELGQKALSKSERESYWGEAYAEFQMARSKGARLDPQI